MEVDRAEMEERRREKKRKMKKVNAIAMDE